MERTILHIDMNNFYASVECLYNPAIRGKPVAVVGDVEQRHGIVLAKNYMAKRYQVSTGDPIWMAKQKCPEIVLVPPHFDRYLYYSAMAREMYGAYTGRVESFGLDECWLDVSSAGQYDEGKRIADELRGRIKEELGVTASVGVSYNKIFAKLGSDMKKPDATTVITRSDFQKIVWPLPVGDLLYVGPATRNKLARYCIRTIGELARTDLKSLRYMLGKIGVMLWSFANGLDASPVSEFGTGPLIKSVGNSTTAPRDLVTDEDVRITLLALCESVAERLRDAGYLCKTVQISIRDNQLQSYERQGALPVPACTSAALFDKAFALYQRNRPKQPVRSLGVRACNLLLDDCRQLSLLPEIEKARRKEALEKTVDSLRRRFGHFSVQRGVMLTDPLLSHLDAKNDHVIHPVSFLN